MDIEGTIKKLNNVEYINNGGCGIAALSTYRFLEKHNLHHNYGFVFLFQDWETDVIEICERRLADGEKNMVVPSHICVVNKITGKFIDANGVDVEDLWVNERDCRHKLFIDDPEVIVETINHPYLNGWNPFFNRAESIWKIQQILGIELKGIRTRI